MLKCRKWNSLDVIVDYLSTHVVCWTKILERPGVQLLIVGVEAKSYIFLGDQKY